MNDEQMQKRYDEHMRQHGDKRVSWKTLMDVIEQTMTALAKPLLAHKEQLDALEKEVAALKADGPNLADAYKGTWLLSVYRRGHVVTHQGAMWLALRHNEEKPGVGDAWKLVVKSGKDLRQ